jgi:cysteine dioxygenase
MIFEKLINSLNDEIILKKVNFKDEIIKNILKEFEISKEDCLEHIKPSVETYSKSLVYKNEYYEIFIITWNTNQNSKIHDHSENGCWLKIIDGRIQENIYDINLQINKINIINKNEIGFMDNNIGFHSIFNLNSDITVSIHIYSPINHKTKYY